MEYPRNITCSDETDRFLILPRGCKDDLIIYLIITRLIMNFEEHTNLGTKISLILKGR